MEEIEIKYPPNINPIKVYSPKECLAIFSTLALPLKAVFDKMKETNAVINGMRMSAAVKLKFYVYLENILMPLRGMGVNLSDKLFLLRELYPLTNHKEDRAA